jgi:hypothetical protein
MGCTLHTIQMFLSEPVLRCACCARAAVLLCRATSVVACVPAYVSNTGEGFTVGGAHLDQVRRRC